MSILSQVKTGKKIGPPRAVIYSDPKGGKTTLFASIPGLVMIPLEDGRGVLEYAELPQPSDYETLLETLRVLAVEDHPYRAVGIDGLTGVEELIRAHVLVRDFDDDMGKFMAYHKGYEHCAQVWVEFCQALDAVRRRGLSIWCAAHAKNFTVDDVVVGAHARVMPSLHEKVIGVVNKWADIIGYIEVEKFGTRKEAAKNAAHSTLTAQATGVHRLIVCEDGAHMAGNRYGLDSPIALPIENPYGPLREALMKATGMAPKKTDETKEAA